MNSKKEELGNILSQIDVSHPRASLSASISSETNAFADVTSFLNINTKPTTLFELKKEFTSHVNLLDDVKLDNHNHDILNDDDSADEEDDNAMYQKEQFLTFIHSGDTIYDDNNICKTSSLSSPKIAKQYSLSVLSRNIINPYTVTPTSPVITPMDENKENLIDLDNDPNHLNLINISSEPNKLETATSVPINIFADPYYICSKNKSRINWKFGFVTTTAQWRPEFLDVIKLKQFNLKTAAKIFKNGMSFKTPKSHEKWKNIFWFFDERTMETKLDQKNATSGMKQYLNDYHDGIILKYNHKYNISECDTKRCLELIGDDDAIEKNICCGVLRVYCHCDIVKWKTDINININEKIVCVSCNKQYKKEEKENEDTNECSKYWIEGISKKHNNLKVFLCVKCVIELVIEGTDKEQLDIYSYLRDSLTNNRKIPELCLVHRLFATSSQLMQLLINSFCQHFEDSEIAGMLKVINFVIKWVNFLWFEDFRKDSKGRLLLNKFISFLLEETNSKNQYGSIWKATQKLIKNYRDQYLFEQQLNAELEANILNDTNGRYSNQNGMQSISPNISSKIQLQNNLNHYFSDDEDSDDDYFQHDLFKDNKMNGRHKTEQFLIPTDLAWYKTENDEKKQKFLNYILQKRNSIDQLRKYQSKEVQYLKKTKSFTLGSDPNEVIPMEIHKSMPFKATKKSKSKSKLKSKSKSKSRLKSKSIHEKEEKKNSLDTLNVIKSYDIQHCKPNTPNIKTSKSAFLSFSSGHDSVHKESIFLQDHCREFAEQLTLITFDLFAAIRATEFLRKAWTKKDKHLSAPNIAELIIFMESVTVWAKFEIAIEINKYRKKTIERICRIGIELLYLGNQYGAVQIYLSLISTDLKWFKNDLEILFEINELKLFMNNIEKLIDHSRNYESLRSKLWNLEAPAIPYLGVFLKDAFKATELLKISKLQKVNPKQMELLFNVYDKIELFRNISYSKKIKKNNIIIQYIHRQLHRAKKLNVRALSQFCKQQSIKERIPKRSFWKNT